MEQYRTEWKYCSDARTLVQLKEKMAGVMERDAYAQKDGKYEIHSLYFDDYTDTCARENIAGEGRRFKYRIRYYNNDAKRLKLEKKEKVNSYCHKRSCPLTVAEYGMILQGKAEELYWQTEERLLKEFCLAIMMEAFSPKVIVVYEREAFVEPVNNVRITFDFCVSASDCYEDFLGGTHSHIPILAGNQHILEIKFDDVLPSYIRQAVQSDALTQQAFSKYYLSRQAMKKFYQL